MSRLDLAVLLLLVGAALGEDAGLPNIDLKSLAENSSIAALQNLDPANLPNVEQTVEQTAELFKKKCEQNSGGSGAYTQAMASKDVMVECIKSLVNVTELQQEMEVARPTGELDSVFKKYCGRTPDMKKCVQNFTKNIEPCLDAQEQDNLKVIMNITDALLAFTCFKEGDRIALFISAEGPECFQNKQNELQECMNSTVGNFLSDVSGPATSLPSLLFGMKECKDMEKLQNCSVVTLETCSDPTPANIVESLFDFIKKSTPCGSLLKNFKAAAITSDGVNSARGLPASAAAIVIASALLRLV